MATVRTILGLIPALAYVPLHLLQRRLAPGTRSPWPRLFHGQLLRALGFHIRVSGAPHTGRPTLFVANHLSWSDVPLLGALIEGRFIAKADLQQDRIVGWFAGLQRTLYVTRAQRVDMGERRKVIAAALAEGDNLILFPEGTTSDGRSVLPFRSALLSILEDPEAADVAVQPVTIAYSEVNGIPVSRQMLPLVVWLGEVSLGAHALGVMKLGRIRADVVFHAPVRLADYSGRKAFTASLEGTVAAGYRAVMRGREVASGSSGDFTLQETAL